MTGRTDLAGSNVGFVIYRKGDAPGTLDAWWTYENAWSGPGHATGGPEEGFAGRYHIRYYDEDGAFSDEYDLLIEKTAIHAYEASWMVDGVVRAVGLGTEVDGALALGWTRVGD